MKSYTALRDLYGTLTNNDTSANKTLGDQLINDAYRLITSARDWDFLQRTKTDNTVASQQFYNLPADYDSLVNVTVTIGTTVYTPRECPSKVQWDILNATTSWTSNFPEWFFVFNGQLGFYPTPSSSTSGAITYTYRKRVRDLSSADYTTGNVSAITSGALAVTGSGTTWTAPMASRFIKFTPTDTANASGDGLWYEISSVGGATALTLTDAYLGSTISSNTAYTIGQMPLLPEPYQVLPVYKATEVYFTTINPELERAQMFKQQYEEYYSRLLADYGPKTTNVVIDTEPRYPNNPNLFVSF